jgi:hypothetical protein
MFSFFKSPVEVFQTERAISCFGFSFVRDNPSFDRGFSYFSNFSYKLEETVYILCFSLILLDSELNNNPTAKDNQLIDPDAWISLQKGVYKYFYMRAIFKFLFKGGKIFLESF